MQFLVLVWNDPTADPYVPAEDNIEAWVAEHDAAGRRREGDRLQAPQDGRTVRVRSGKLLVTEGPFVETQEQIAGFDLLECADLDEAVKVAADHPMARFGTLEVRPFWNWES
ncbi:YciI family protein [Cellulomonas sp. URHE0023]|uniref:YciI family protein n=1 Tax=Cellulomonas sp. URHE0023 TaxID=1380354 RepID=UPI000480A158|nr:YciI family protein [Cellulomonas sp. URHE0023]